MCLFPGGVIVHGPSLLGVRVISLLRSIPCCLVLLSEIMDSNSFPLVPAECTHLLALVDSKILYQLQLPHVYWGPRSHVCDLPTPHVVGLCMCRFCSYHDSKILKVEYYISGSWIPPPQHLGQQIHGKLSRGNEQHMSESAFKIWSYV